MSFVKGLFIVIISAFLAIPGALFGPVGWALAFVTITIVLMWLFRTAYICSRCGFSSYSPKKFCPICGGDVVTRCLVCGKRIKNKIKHCENCGTKIESMVDASLSKNIPLLKNTIESMVDTIKAKNVDMFQRIKNTLEANDFTLKDNGIYTINDTTDMDNVFIYGKIIGFKTVVTLCFSCDKEESEPSVDKLVLMVDDESYDIDLRGGVGRGEVAGAMVDVGALLLNKQDLPFLTSIAEGYDVYYLCYSGVDYMKVDFTKEEKEIILETVDVTQKINAILEEGKKDLTKVRR